MSTKDIVVGTNKRLVAEIVRGLSPTLAVFLHDRHPNTTYPPKPTQIA